MHSDLIFTLLDSEIENNVDKGEKDFLNKEFSVIKL